MELWAALGLAVLLLVPLLYGRCGSFRFFCKMGFYNGWILLLALVAIPLCARRGRDVANMRWVRARGGRRVSPGSLRGAAVTPPAPVPPGSSGG